MVRWIAKWTSIGIAALVIVLGGLYGSGMHFTASVGTSHIFSCSLRDAQQDIYPHASIPCQKLAATGQDEVTTQIESANYALAALMSAERARTGRFRSYPVMYCDLGGLELYCEAWQEVGPRRGRGCPKGSCADRRKRPWFLWCGNPEQRASSRHCRGDLIPEARW